MKWCIKYEINYGMDNSEYLFFLFMNSLGLWISEDILGNIIFIVRKE